MAKFGTGADRIAWGFLALGAILRIGRYLANYPLWGDEAALAANILQRDVAALIRPLDFGQVAPLLFLVAEKAMVEILGFSEMSLRLLPLACALAALPLFHRLAGEFQSGWGRALTVGLFAVSFHPLRHAAQVKPYAGDLLVATALLLAGILAIRRPDQRRWPWVVAALTPFALGFSLPSLFVLAGVLLATCRIGRSGRDWPAWGATLAMAAGSFLLLIRPLLAARPGGARGLREYWGASFPTTDGIGSLVGWLLDVHTGSVFAYPGGGRNGGSIATSLLVVVGVIVLVRARDRRGLTLLLAPFGVTLAAAALRKYPYGGEARIAQHLAPAICLLAGIGLEGLVRALPWPKRRPLAIAAIAFAWLAIGLGLGYVTVANASRATYEGQAREWARRFWPEVGGDAEVLCLYRDLGIRPRRGPFFLTATYACNQAIYRPEDDGLDWSRIAADRPLRCVLYDETRPDDPNVVLALEGLGDRYHLVDRREVVVPFDCTFGGAKDEHVWIFDFVPKASATAARPVEPPR